jgi:hypothetical protein
LRPAAGAKANTAVDDEFGEFFTKGEQGDYEGGLAYSQPPSRLLPEFDEPPRSIRTAAQDARRNRYAKLVTLVVTGCVVLLAAAAGFSTRGGPDSPRKEALRSDMQLEQPVLAPSPEIAAVALMSPPSEAAKPVAAPPPPPAPEAVEATPPKVDETAEPKPSIAEKIAQPSAPVAEKVALASAPVAEKKAEPSAAVVATTLKKSDLAESASAAPTAKVVAATSQTAKTKPIVVASTAKIGRPQKSAADHAPASPAVIAPVPAAVVRSSVVAFPVD